MRAHQDDLRAEVDDEALIEAVGRGEYRDAKLSDAQVAEIRASSGLLKELAEKYGVSMAAISLIRRGLRR